MLSQPTKLFRAVTLALFLEMLACMVSSCARGPSTLLGAVVERNSDPRKRPTIPGVQVTAKIGSTSNIAQTDALGYFHVSLRGWVRNGEPLHLEFSRPGYQPLSLDSTVSDKLYVVEMAPLHANSELPAEKPPSSIANLKVRYSMKSAVEVNVGSAAKAFEVVNQGNIPCDGRNLCSPDGKWRATLGSTTLNAGQGNEFRNVRLSCIAGPCPFTRVQADRYSTGGNEITASVLDWSDTTTFLLEAEVYHPMLTDVVQDSYPVIFGRTFNFSVPITGEGVSIEVDVNGESIVFPLGPSLCLSWATCTAKANSDRSKTYHCELKNGFQFP